MNVSSVPEWVDDLAAQLRGKGLSYDQIAEELQRRHIPTPSPDSLRWHNSAAKRAVRRALDRVDPTFWPVED